MTYKIVEVTDSLGQVVRPVGRLSDDGTQHWFTDDESNDGPERQAYLAWLAEGNEPEVVEL